MTPKSATQIALVEAISQPTLKIDSKKSRSAVRRCCAAWQKAYDACLAGMEENGITRAFAANAAGPAYCKAMPPLAGQENIRDFIACVAHGILINAIPEKRVNQLLYAAQVALTSLKRGARPRKSA